MLIRWQFKQRTLLPRKACERTSGITASVVSTTTTTTTATTNTGIIEKSNREHHRPMSGRKTLASIDKTPNKEPISGNAFHINGSPEQGHVTLMAHPRKQNAYPNNGNQTQLGHQRTIPGRKPTPVPWKYSNQWVQTTHLRNIVPTKIAANPNMGTTGLFPEIKGLLHLRNHKQETHTAHVRIKTPTNFLKTPITGC